MEIRPVIGQRAFVLWGYLITILAAAHSLTWKMGNDQAVFTVVAQTIVDGGIPYRDSWDFKGPLTFYAYAAALWLWNRPGLSIRILDLFALLACALMLRRLVSVIVKDALIADVTLIVVSLMYFSLGYWNTAQPDGWSGFILVGVVLLLIESPWKASTTMAIAGALVAIATLFKPTFAVYLMIPMVFPCVRVPKATYPIRDVCICIVTFSVTVVTPLALIAVASRGWEDMVDIGRFYLGHASSRVPLRIFGEPFFRIYLVPIVLTVVGLVLLQRSWQSRVSGMMALWVMLGLAVPALQGKYWPYHFIPFLVAVAVPIAVTLLALKTSDRRWALIATVVVMSAPLAVCSLYDKDSSALYERPQVALATYIVANSDAHERIQVVAGELIPVYALSGRRPSSRFSFSYPLIMASGVKEKFRSTYMREIEQVPPYFVLINSVSGPRVLKELPEFDAYLDANYTLVTTIQSNEVWQLKRAGRIDHPQEEVTSLKLGPWWR